MLVFAMVEPVICSMDVGTLEKDGYRVEIQNLPACAGYSTKPFFFVTIYEPGGKKITRIHHSIADLKKVYSSFFDISGLKLSRLFAGTE